MLATFLGILSINKVLLLLHVSENPIITTCTCALLLDSLDHTKEV